MGEVHIRAYQSLPQATVAGVFDTDEEKARRIGEQYGVRVFDSLPSMIESGAVEAVSVCSSDEYHVAPTLACLEAGLPVLLEKPIATSLEDADRIIEAADKSSAPLLVGHVLRFEEHYARAKEAVDAGEIGRVVSLFARRVNAASAQERLKGRVSVLSFLGVHDFDICSWFAGGRPVRLYADSAVGVLSGRGYQVEDQAFTTVRYDNGVVACVESGWVLPDTHPRKADFSLEVMGEHGVINLNLMHQGLSICSDRFTFPAFSHGVAGELSHFLACAAGTQTPRISPPEARSALELSLAAVQSSTSGRAVALPLSAASRSTE